MTPDRVAEWRAREDLAACSRLLVFREILDYSGHVSARLPEKPDRVLIQPRDSSRAALRAEELLVVDLEGTVISGDGPPPVELEIHLGVYRARPDVNMVCHGHPTLSTSFSMSTARFLPMRHFAYKYGEGLAIHPDPTHIRTRQQGEAVAATLGSADACLLRSHGTVVVAESMPELLMNCLDLEENARTQLIAGQVGELVPLDAEEIRMIDDSYSLSGHRANKLWNHVTFLARAAGVFDDPQGG